MKIYYKDYKKKLRRYIGSINDMYDIGSSISGKDGKTLLYSYIDQDRDDIDIVDDQDLDSMRHDIPKGETMRIYVRDKGEQKKWCDKYLRDAWVFDPKTGQKIKYSSKTPQISKNNCQEKEKERESKMIEMKKKRVVQKFEMRRRVLENEYQAQLKKLEKIEEEARVEANKVEKGKVIWFEVKKEPKKETKKYNDASSIITARDIDEGNVDLRGGILVKLNQFNNKLEQVKVLIEEEKILDINMDRLEKVIAKHINQSAETLIKYYKMHRDKWIVRKTE